MASSFPPLLFMFMCFILPSLSRIQRDKTLSESVDIPLNDTSSPTAYIQVTKPINVPNSKPCIVPLLRHDFASTFGKPPVIANYSPPSHCPFSRFSKIVLEWNATSRGPQFDRIFGVWLAGVELLRSCTAEPTPAGTFWSVQKDISRYSSLLLRDETQQLAVYIGNIVDSYYTGVYHVNITLYFYSADEKPKVDDLSNLKAPDVSKADLILPISRNFPLNGGLWFEIHNSTEPQLKEFQIPQNVYRAVLEVYVSFHENDELWFANYPNDYVNANNLTENTVNGPFREVLVSLDGDVVGAIWPFTVIYTGGVNPLFWRPITAIGSFDLPSYEIEITPFLGDLLDGKIHKLGFAVTNALNVWYIDANLHLWLDQKSGRTRGEVLSLKTKPLVLSSTSNFKGLNGSFFTHAQRNISARGWVKSSIGKITTHFQQQFSYRNSMDLAENMNLQIVNQTIRSSESVSFRKANLVANSFESLRKFDLDYYSDSLDQGNGSWFHRKSIEVGFNEEKGSRKSKRNSVKNVQKGEGVMVVKNKLVSSGEGKTMQVYEYQGSELCYYRNVSSSNYTFIYDIVKSKCNNIYSLA